MSARVIRSRAGRSRTGRGRAGLATALAVALLGLAGCSGGTDAPPVQLQIFDAARGSAGRMAARLRGGQAAAPTLSRAQLEATGLTITEVTAERRELTAYLFRALERRDSDPGLIEVWSTEDSSVTVTTRQGVVIATRGLGGDLLSSRVEVADSRPGPAGGGAQVQMIRNLDFRETALALSCELADLGAETIEILGQRQATRHLRQSCEGGGGQVVNDYWTDAASGIVWQSRQWAGPHVGYLRLRRVTK